MVIACVSGRGVNYDNAMVIGADDDTVVGMVFMVCW